MKANVGLAIIKKTMREITGDIFKIYSWSSTPSTAKLALCVTTNGVVKKRNKNAVMGAGIAKAFAGRYPQLPAILGRKLIESGNQVHHLLSLGNVDIISFPTKHHWRDRSDLNLIIISTRTLAILASSEPDCTFVLPKPGCGLGGLSWSEVKNMLSPILPDNCWIINL